jgi:hypothetical protein
LFKQKIKPTKGHHLQAMDKGKLSEKRRTGDYVPGKYVLSRNSTLSMLQLFMFISHGFCAIN